MSDIPAGLDDFIAAPTASVSKSEEAIPAGLDEFASEQLKKDKYSGVIPTLKAAGLGAARSASFGTSDQLLTASKFMTPEEIKDYEEQHPIATGVGEVGGILGAVVAPEAGVLGALSAPVKAVSRLGGAVGETLVPAAEATSPAIQRIIAKAAQVGAGSAVEGAVYGLGQSVSEHALGDPDLNAEKVLSNVGTGAVFGGLLGGALGAAEVAVPEAVTAAKKSLTKLYDVAVGLPGEEPGILGKAYAQTSSFVSGKPSEQIIEALQNRAKSLVKPEEQKELVSEFSSGLKEQHEKVNKALYDANKSARLSESASYLKEVPGEVALPEMEKAVSQIKTAIKEMRSEPDLYPQSYPRILEQINDRVAKEVGSESSAFDVFKALDDLKGRLDEEISYGTAPSGGDLRAQSTIGNIRRAIKNTLEEPEIWGEAASRQAAFNDAQSQFFNLVGKKGVFRSSFMSPALGKGGKLIYEVSPSKVETYLKQISSLRGEAKTDALKKYLEVSDNLVNEIDKTYKSVPSGAFDKSSIESILSKNKEISNKAIEQSEINKTFNALGAGAHNVQFGEGAAATTGLLGHPIAAAALETAAMLKAPGLAIQRLAKLERMISQTGRAIDKGVSVIFKGGAKAGEETAGFLGTKVNEDKKKKDFKKVTSQLNELSNDPTKLISSMDQMTRPIMEHAPGIAQGLQMTGTRAVTFLQSKIPGNNIDPKPLSPPYEPSSTEMNQWHKYVNAVENPTSALTEVANGTLSKETMETLAMVYPKLLSDMQMQVTSGMIDAINKKKTIPYKTKLTLSMFLGNDLVRSLDSKSILRSQGIQGAAGQMKALQESSQMIRSSAKNLSKINEANRYLTPMQEASARKEA